MEKQGHYRITSEYRDCLFNLFPLNDEETNNAIKKYVETIIKIKEDIEVTYLTEQNKIIKAQVKSLDGNLNGEVKYCPDGYSGFAPYYSYGNNVTLFLTLSPINEVTERKTNDLLKLLENIN